MQTAYLKAHYPTEFFAGLLSSVVDDTDALVPYLFDAKKYGINIKNPDINSSDLYFTANVDGSITYGLSAIKTVGEAAVKQMLEERGDGFTCLTDFMKRCPQFNSRAVESLISAGALDCFGETRRTLVENIKNVQKGIKEAAKEIDGQMDLFNQIGTTDSFASLPEYSKKERLEKEKDALGYYLSGHPFEEYQKVLPKNMTTTKNVKEDSEDESIMENYRAKECETTFRTAGIICNVKQLFTKKDNSPMAVFDIEDVFGKARCIAFPKTYAKYKDTIKNNEIIAMRSRPLVDNDNELTLSAYEIMPIKDAPVVIWIKMKTEEEFLSEKEWLVDTINETGNGDEIIRVYIEARKGTKDIAGVTKDIIPVLKEHFGTENVAEQIQI